MATIGRLEYSAVRDYASNMRTCAANINEKLDELKKDMNTLDSVYHSTASEALLTKFQEFSAKYKEFPESVENFAKFLNAVVEKYSTLDSQFKSSVDSSTTV